MSLPTYEQLAAVYGNNAAKNINQIFNAIKSGDVQSIGLLQQVAPEISDNLGLSSIYNTYKYDPSNFSQTQASNIINTIFSGESTVPGGSVGSGGNGSTGGTGGSSSPQPTKVQEFLNGIKDLPYYNTPAFQEIVNQFTSDAGRTLPNEQAVQNWISNFKSYGSTFGNQFKNLAGRDPTADEYNTFLSEVIVPMQPWFKTPDQLQVSQLATDTINRDFSSVINQAAEDKSKQQANEMLAPGSAFDIWQKGYNKSISDTEGQLQDYQSKLFEKLRPQLLTSLQAQGLLDSGALNTAFAGAAKDLGESTSNYLSGVKSQAAADIANKKYAIQSSPGTFALTNTFNTPGNLTAYGQNALNNAFNYNANMNLANMQNVFTKQLYDSQNKGSSPLSQYGGLLAGGIIGGFGKSAGGYAAQKMFT